MGYSKRLSFIMDGSLFQFNSIDMHFEILSKHKVMKSID